MYGIVRLKDGKPVIVTRDDDRFILYRTQKQSKKTVYYLNQTSSKHGYKYFSVPLPVIKDYSQYD